MKVTLNAHQLTQLINKTSGHMGCEDIEPLHGIRLEVGSSYLYAIASDRYTLAVARYRLLNDDKNGESAARTIPGGYLRSLREWIDSQAGQDSITISTDVGRLIFSAAVTELRIPVTDNLEFPDWRGILRNVTAQTVDSEPFPALSSAFLARWADTGQTLRVRITADHKPALVFAEDFIGAQMPTRYAGVGPVKDETVDSARALWKDVLDTGTSRADMATDMPEAEPGPRYEATKDIRETGEGLLHEVLRSSRELRAVDYDTNRDLWDAYIRIGVANWMAYRFLDALHTADPRLAASTVADVAEQLDSGEIGEWAWDAAQEAGHDPQKWHDDYEAHLKSRAEKKDLAVAGETS